MIDDPLIKKPQESEYLRLLQLEGNYTNPYFWKLIYTLNKPYFISVIITLLLTVTLIKTNNFIIKSLSFFFISNILSYIIWYNSYKEIIKVSQQYEKA